ncbi:MAG TPA: hypothetical protein EYO64_01530, partial [Candidatus Nitrosopelagicus sp.]|nr:hypothetical protein [Candidatus Nitrosopelagicus sp.]
ITGIFYVYDDEKLAREHVDPTIFARLDKAKSPKEEEKDADAKPAKADAEPAKADAEPAKADAPVDKPDTKTKDKSEDN